MESRKPVIERGTQLFFSAINEDKFPQECAERLYGVKMNDPVGRLVYNCWVTLVKYAGVASEEGINDAMLQGRMPEYFEGLVQALPLERHSHYTYSLIERKLFDSIPWDRDLLAKHMLHRACAEHSLGRNNSCPSCRFQLPKNLCIGGSYAIDSCEKQLETRLREWIISGMCDRCVMHYHEKDPLILLDDPNGQNRM
eukprot:gene29467-36703_t